MRLIKKVLIIIILSSIFSYIKLNPIKAAINEYSNPGASLGISDYNIVGDCNGMEISSAGDVDGDGLNDILIGCENYDSHRGKTYLFLSSHITGSADASLDFTNADYSFVGEGTQDSSGAAVSSAGDVDGDGLGDILIGAWHYFGRNYCGKVYLVLGATIMNSISLGETSVNLRDADYSFIGERSDAMVGISVSTAGDVDGDGLDDILIGSFDNNKAYLVLGSTIMGLGIGSPSVNLRDADYIFFSDPYEWVGRSVSDAGDIDGDGLGDILISAQAAREGDSSVGKAYLFLGSTIVDLTDPSVNVVNADYSFIGENRSDTGSSVSSAGDINGDGFGDILIGASHNPDNGAGKVYLFSGMNIMNSDDSSISVTDADYTFLGENPGDQIGYSNEGISDAGDVDGDGLGDILIGCKVSEKAYLITGSAIENSLSLGHTSMNLRGADYCFIDEYTGDTAKRTQVSYAGDINGDGLSDVLLAAPGTNSGGCYTGKAYVVLGNLIDRRPNLTITDVETIRVYSRSRNQIAVVRVTVQNTGITAIEPGTNISMHYNYRISGPKTGSYNNSTSLNYRRGRGFVGLLPGESMSIIVEVYPSLENYQMRYFVDLRNMIEESNENDNVYIQETL